MNDALNDVTFKKKLNHGWMGDTSCDFMSISKFENRI
jgi:hypothetical protein